MGKEEASGGRLIKRFKEAVTETSSGELSQPQF